MNEYAEGCQPKENEHPSEPAAASGQGCSAGPAKTPYAIIWKDGKELELY